MGFIYYLYRFLPKTIIVLIGSSLVIFYNPTLANGNALDKVEETKTEVSLNARDFMHYTSWNKLLNKLERKKNLPAPYFIDYLFYKTQQSLFSVYKKHSNFEETLANGSYDCVSASIAYSLLLDYFDIPHSIIETDYHVFIIVNFGGQEFIYESTDPLNGFIKDKLLIEEFISNFKNKENFNKITSDGESNKNHQNFTQINTIYKIINFEQLNGLQYYNQAVYALNQKQHQLAKERMSHALQLYPSERVQSVFRIISGIEE